MSSWKSGMGKSCLIWDLILIIGKMTTVIITPPSLPQKKANQNNPDIKRTKRDIPSDQEETKSHYSIGIVTASQVLE